MGRVYKVFAILLCLCCLTPTSLGYKPTESDSEPREMVSRWVSSSKPLESSYVNWTIGNEVVDRDGNLFDSFDTLESSKFWWPREMIVETRLINQGDGRDSMRALQTDRESRIGPDGRQIEQSLRTSNKRDLGNQTLLGIVGSQSHRAPYLLGLWLAVHPEAIDTAQNNADGTVSLVLEQLHLRMTLASFHTPDEATHPVVTKLEVLDAEENPVMWWEYDDFQQIGSTGHYTGRFRIQYSTRGGTLYESPPSRIEEIGLLERRASKPIETGLIVPAEDISSPDIHDDEQTQEVPQQRNRVRKTMRIAPSVLIGVGVFMLGVVGIRFILRIKSRS